MLVGYKLIDSEGVVIETWGGVRGECPGVPAKLRLPHGNVHCPELNTDYEGYTLVPWELEDENE